MQFVAGRYMSRLFVTIAALAFFPLIGSLPLAAQGSAPIQPEPQQGNGVNPWATYSGVKDNVNLVNGNLSFCIPLVSLPGPQMPPGLPAFNLDIPLCYNSNFETVWTTGTGGEAPVLSWFPWTWAASTPPLGPGWALTGHPGLFDQSGTSSTGYPLASMPDGSTYSFDGWSGPQNSPGWQQDTQGGDLYMTAYDQDGDPLYLKNGIKVAPTCVGCSGASQYNEVETDTEGDTITFTANSVTDAVGRTVTINSTSSAMTFTYPNPAGSGTLTTTVQFENVAFTCNGGSEVGINEPVGTSSMPTAVILPNGLEYTFQYDNCGELRQINYPDGGYTRYSYTEVQLAVIAGANDYYPYPVNEVSQKAVCPVPASVTPYTADQCPVPEQVTTYAPVSGGYNNSQNTVTDPAGDYTVYQFSQADPLGTVGSQAAETSRAMYGTSGNLMKTVTTTYVTSANSAACLTGGGSEDMPTVPATQITTLDNGEESEVNWYYDCNTPIIGPTQLVQKQEYDFGATAGKIGPLLRTTDYDWLNLDNSADYGVPTTTYPNAKHILDRKTSVIVYDGSGKLISKTLYFYDGNDSGTEGILTKTEKWRSTDGAMLTTTWNNWEYTYPNGTTVAYGFANNYAGGENPSTAAYPTTITTVANGTSYVQQRQYYYGSGLVAAACGNNYSGSCTTGKSNVPDYTSYTYDLMGRETSALSGDGGETTTCYSDDPGSSCYSSSGPVKTVATKLIQSGVSETTTNISMYTGSGSVPTTTTEVNSDPNCSGGTVNVDTTYDADGRKSTVSNPYCSANPDAPTAGTTTYAYDGLSRVIQVTNPDGTTTSNTYTGRAELSEDEGNGTRRIERINQNDALGRLISVCEVTSTTEQGSSGTPASCGQDIADTGFLTTYGYDASSSNGPLDAVTSVTQGAETRSFTYDSLGEVLSAANPESGTTNYTSYDSMGNLLSKTDADGITTTYGYNGLNQLLSESYSGGTTPSDCFQYGVSNSGNTMGRLMAEWTQTGTCSSTVPSDGAITERSFTYDLLGRVANDQQCTSIENCGTGTASATINYTYDLAGDVASMNNGLTGSSAMTFTDTYNTADELASMTGPQSAGSGSDALNLFGLSSYIPSGAIATALVGPAISLTRSYNSRLLPTAETDTVATTPGSATVAITGAEQNFGGDDNEVLFGGTESSGMTSAYNVMIKGPDNYLASWTVDATSSDTPNSMSAKVVNAVDTGSCATPGVPYQVSGTGAAVFIVSCQDGDTYYFYAAFMDTCNGSGGSCFSISGGQTDSYDTGTVSLTVNGTQVASASYGENSTPSSLVSSLISASSGNSLVNLTAGTCSGETCNLTVTAQDDGTRTDYSYSVNVDDTSAFGGTSFADSASSGTLEGGTNVPLYNWAVSTYAPDGDVQAMTDSVQGTWSYTYDDMNRVLTADATGGPDSGMDLTWAYDRYGNRWSQTATGSGGGGATQPSLTFNGDTNRADGYSYDAAGNLLNDGLNQYAYDGANRILSINNQATGYVYDAEGDRVAKLNSGGAVETVYVLTAGNAQLDELNGSGGWNHTNIYAPGGRLLATYDSSTQSSPGYHYNLTDWLGTKRMQTSASGDQQEICTSNPYGDGLNCTGGTDATEEHFTGKDHDTESGLDYFYARYYSELLGRFMTPDWAAAPAAVPYAAYGDPQSLNLYAYVQNNPLTGIDATGHYSSSDPTADAEEGQSDAAAGQSSQQAQASDQGSSGNSNSTGKPGTNKTPGANPPPKPGGDSKSPSGSSGKTVGSPGQSSGKLPPPKGLDGPLPGVPNPVDEANDAFNKCYDEKAAGKATTDEIDDGLKSGSSDGKSTSDPATDALFNVGMGSVEAQVECLKENPTADLSKSYQGSFEAGQAALDIF